MSLHSSIIFFVLLLEISCHKIFYSVGYRMLLRHVIEAVRMAQWAKPDEPRSELRAHTRAMHC